uniref:EF-hand domain-containing protein n=1 Tax=Hanusia phi TaxID=3032 RepID=A0A7S0NAJ9_9CRYP|mmetsp:Transcript_4960/g.11729  ORF Transcript_4960/g.11729 Transcript_4960/m.11729 type:complete len:266 (+) Transcript_4960:70-867(+)
MPPQFSRLTSDGSAAVVRRTSSVGQNCDMYTIRLQINQAFQEADKDGSGHLSKQELLKVLESLNITLQNPIDDMDVIFDTLDANHSGHIDLDEWGACFEPAIKRFAIAPDAKMDMEDLMKVTFAGILEDAKKERSMVIEAFMKAYEKVKDGFGTRFLGSKWRFKIYDAFYGAIEDAKIFVPLRYEYLKKKLKEASMDQEPWIKNVLEGSVKAKDDTKESFDRLKSLQDVKKELRDPKVVMEFCSAWLELLTEQELKKAAAEGSDK